MSDVRRVLVLEDEPMVGVLIESIGRIAGAEVRLTSHPDDFFAALAEWAPSHIVLDLTLPGMSGEAVLGKLQSDAAQPCLAHIILTSGVDSQRLSAAEALARGLGLNVAGTLAKPFLPSSLRRLLS